MLLWQPLGRLEGDWEIMVWRGGDIRLGKTFLRLKFELRTQLTEVGKKGRLRFSSVAIASCFFFLRRVVGKGELQLPA
jgi:hypothetical protein